MKRKYKLLILILIIFLLIIIIRSTYSKYTNKAVAAITKPIGQWVIKVNNTDITEVDDEGEPANQEFVIDTFSWDTTTHVVDNKIAPGRGGSFDIVIDPTDTQVSFNYSITIDNPVLKVTGTTEATDDDIVAYITNATAADGKTITFSRDSATGISTITRIKPLSEIQSETNTVRLDTIHVEFEWPNIVESGKETNNDADTRIADSSNSKISFPVNFWAIQYVGE